MVGWAEGCSVEEQLSVRVSETRQLMEDFSWDGAAVPIILSTSTCYLKYFVGIGISSVEHAFTCYCNESPFFLLKSIYPGGKTPCEFFQAEKVVVGGNRLGGGKPSGIR